MRYFERSEFDSPDVKGSGAEMDTNFLRLLDELRHQCGFAFVINSGYRTRAHNKKVGGSPNSSHMKGLAVDIACRSSAERYLIVKHAFELGFSRIGIANSFVHIDNDAEKPLQVIWTY